MLAIWLYFASSYRGKSQFSFPKMLIGHKFDAYAQQGKFLMG